MDQIEILPVEIPAEVKATANSRLNDIVHASGGTGRVSFSAQPTDGLALKDNGDSTFTLTGKAPAKDQSASITVAFQDEGAPVQTGDVVVTVMGCLSPHADVAAEQVSANAD